MGTLATLFFARPTFPFQESFLLFPLNSLAFDFSFLSNGNIRRHLRIFLQCRLFKFEAGE